MQAYWTLVRRELGIQFYSWAGYVVIAAVSFLVAFSFANLLGQLNTEATDVPVTELFYGSYYFWLILLTAVPVITMRSMAMEKYSGTFETLMTTPVSDWEVVLAKYSGAMLFYILLWLPLLACLLVVRYYSNDPTLLEAGTVGSTFLGIILLGSVYVSLGCFASALTRNQIIAAMTSFAIGISLFILSYVAMRFTSGSGWEAQFFNQVSLIEHMQDFARGQLDTRPLVCYVSLTLLFLFLTFKVVESRRWR